MIATILPAGVVSVDTTGDAGEAALHPGEADLVARSVPKRRREFITTRDCARRALSALGYPPAAILTGQLGQPLWPSGVVGSLTHCDGYRAAAVAPAHALAAIGIDAEPDAPLPDGLLDAVSSATERRHLAGLGGGVNWDRLLFSAKESVYKAWYPVMGVFIDFDAAEVRFAHDGTFTAELTVPEAAGGVPGTSWAGNRVPGRWRAAGGLILTAVTG